MQNLKNVSFKNVTFDGGFWKSRYDLNRTASLESVYKRFEETGRFDALRFNYEKGLKPYPHFFFDSDVAKWIEAVAYLIMKNGGYEKEQKVIDELVQKMAENQTKCGYLNSHFIQICPDKIFTDRDMHELYCAGHLIEAAVAYDEATGKHEFLHVVERYADCIYSVFVTQKTAAFITPGHEEIELALLRLYSYTKKTRYLDLAMHFINERGKQNESKNELYNDAEYQSDMPVRDFSEAEGHAVRAAYLYIAMSEAYIETGDRKLLLACNRVFDDIIKRKMYITGGIGSSAKGEAFTVPYDLPNLEAYSESCAALGLQLFALSMQQTALDPKFAGVIERVMYNNMLSSTSLDGKAFFYENPLEIHLADVNKERALRESARTHLPITHRLEVFDCSCCPPNINRVFARMGDFFFSESGDALVVNQYADLTLKNEKAEIKLSTDYPASGIVKFTVKNFKYDKLLLRKPEWCERYSVTGAEYEEKDGYIYIAIVGSACGANSKKTNRPAQNGNSTDCTVKEFTVDFEMTARFIEANPRVRANNGRVALTYGPVVYSLERIDNPYELNALSVDINAEIKKRNTNDFGGVLPELIVSGFVDCGFNSLYRFAKCETAPVTLRFRPYYSFANREETDMLIWIRRK